MKLQDLINNIDPLDRAAMDLASKRQNKLTKPAGSLGRLEDLSNQIAGITGQTIPILQHKVVIICAADHGVVSEGVSAYPQAVTYQMVINFLRGGAGINVLANHIGARVVIVDMGVANTLPADPNLIIKKIAPGTRNIAIQPAMTHAQALQGILTGASIVEEEIKKGMDILATGDMGIGNTTPSAAIAAALTSLPPYRFVGRGTGLDDEGLTKKVRAVELALANNKPNPMDGIDVLTKVGGFEIAGLTGAILASAANHRPVVIDGFISTAAAMIAASLAPQVCDYMIAAHCSQETGHDLMLDWLKLTPLLDFKMRLGEGSGAALAMFIVEASCKLLAEMATFEEAGVSNKGKL